MESPSGEWLASFNSRDSQSPKSESKGPESPLSMSLRLSLARECSDGSSLGSGPQLRRRASIVAAKSFKSDGREASVETQSPSSNTLHGKFRKAAHFLVNYHYLSNFMGVVVVFDSYFTGFDIDSRALGNPTPQVILACSDICLALYTLEICLILYVGGISILKDWMVILDSFIILCGYTEIVFNYMDMASEVASRITILRVLRMARIVRLMRLLRKSRSLKELQKLVTMMATCLKALAWSFLFCFVIMTVWAMLMVEIVHPVIQEIQQEKGVFDGCEQCVRSCQSVMDANLLLFKTVIAGDSWGTIAVPVIEAYPGTAFIFVGSLLTLVFGVLNLIVAVVVDTFAEVRQSDVMNLAEEMEHVEMLDQKFLQKIFDRIDVNKKGLLTLEDIMAGARTDAEFQSRLRVMDIDEVDLQQLFEMIDVDGSGAIESEEFIVHDSKTAPRFIKYNLMHVMHQQQDLIQNLERHFVVLNSRMSDLEDNLEHMDSPGRQQVFASSDGIGNDLHAETVQAPRLSKKVGRLKMDAVDAMKPAVAALNESLTDALKLSVAKMEAILREELSKCYPEPPGPPPEDVKAAPQEVAMSIQQPEPPQPDSPRDKASRLRLSQRLQSQGSPLLGVLPRGCLGAKSSPTTAEDAALQLAWRMLEQAGVVPSKTSEDPWPREYLHALPQRPALPLLWPASEVSELQDAALQLQISELGERVDQWLQTRCQQLGLDATPLQYQFRAAFATTWPRAIELRDRWILAPFLDAVEPLGIDAEGKGVTEGNCKIEVEDIGQGQQRVVLSATKDLKEGDVLTQELKQLSPRELLFSYGRSLPEDFLVTLEVKACIENAPAKLQQLPGARPGRLPGDLLLQGTLRPWARYAEEDGTRLDDLKAMIDENFLSAALILAKEQLEVGDFVNLTGRRKLRCLQELLRLLRSCRGEFATSLKEDSKQLASAQGCRRLALQHRVSSKRALRLVIEEVKEAVARAEDGGGLPFAFSGRK